MCVCARAHVCVCPQSVLHILLHFAKGHDFVSFYFFDLFIYLILEAAVVVDKDAPHPPFSLPSQLSDSYIPTPLDPCCNYATLYLPIPHVVEEGHGVGATSLHTQNELDRYTTPSSLCKCNLKPDLPSYTTRNLGVFANQHACTSEQLV